MKRRNFVRTLLAAPAAPALAQQAAQPAAAPAPAAAPPARTMFGVHEVANLALTPADLAADTARTFFNAEQFAALEKLAQLFVPPLKGKPGALDAHAPEFLDFLLRVSPAERQQLYTNGLDGLNAQARQQFHRAFSELDGKQADAIVRPLVAARAWDLEYPSDPLKRFIAEVHDDLRTATRNSREWAAAAESSGRRARGFSRSAGFYWKPIDPVVRD
jgi:hypothetical protein